MIGGRRTLLSDLGRSQPSVADDVVRHLCRRLPDIVARSRLTLCGMSAGVDARIAMHDMAMLLEARDPPEAAGLATLLTGRAARSIGGDWELIVAPMAPPSTGNVHFDHIKLKFA